MISFKEYLEEAKRGLWDNIHAKQERIKHGSGEKMRKPGSKGAPTDKSLKDSQNEAANPAQQAAIAIAIKKAGKKPKNEEFEQIAELDTKTLKSYVNKNLKSNDTSDKRDTGLYRATNKIAKTQATSTLDKKVKTLGNTSASAHKNRYEYEASRSELKDRGIHNFAGRRTRTEEVEAQFDLIEEVVEEMAATNGVDSELVWEWLEVYPDEELLEYAIDAKGYKSSTGGLTQKGVDHYRRQTPGSHLQTAVTTKPSKLKPGSKAANRRKSFCARMSGVEGPMKKPNGEPTRKALALRKWHC